MDRPKWDDIAVPIPTGLRTLSPEERSEFTPEEKKTLLARLKAIDDAQARARVASMTAVIH